MRLTYTLGCWLAIIVPARAALPSSGELSVRADDRAEDVFEAMRRWARRHGAQGFCRFVAGPAVSGSTRLRLSAGKISVEGWFACDMAALDRMIEGRAAAVLLHSWYRVGNGPTIDGRETIYGPRGGVLRRDPGERKVLSGVRATELLAHASGRDDAKLTALEVRLSPGDDDASQPWSLSPHTPLVRRPLGAGVDGGEPRQLTLKEAVVPVQRRFRDVRACAESGSIVFEIDLHEGDVGYLNITSSTLPPAAERCVVDIVRALAFPRGDAFIAVPLVLDPPAPR